MPSLRAAASGRPSSRGFRARRAGFGGIGVAAGARFDATGTLGLSAAARLFGILATSWFLTAAGLLALQPVASLSQGLYGLVQIALRGGSPSALLLRGGQRLGERLPRFGSVIAFSESLSRRDGVGQRATVQTRVGQRGDGIIQPCRKGVHVGLGDVRHVGGYGGGKSLAHRRPRSPVVLRFDQTVRRPLRRIQRGRIDVHD